MFDASVFIEKFKEEALERLQRLNELYISFEGESSNQDLLAEMMREAHTLKGSAKMVGLGDISTLAHKLEEILISIKEGQREPKAEVSDAFFILLDAMLELTEQGKNDEVIRETALNSAESILETDHKSSEKFEESKSEEKKEYNYANGKQVEQEEEKIKSHEMTTIRVRASQIDTLLNLMGETVIYANRLENEVLNLRELSKELRNLSELWNMLVKNNNLLDSDDFTQEQIRSFEALLNRSLKRTESLREIAEIVSRSNFYLNDLHEKLMELRMLPASYILNLFPRAVRDMAKEFSKEINLVIEGEDTPIDKRVLEEIHDPLIHILRNAVDHGIEMPEEREALGKPREGTIKISAAQEGDRIIIRVSDDGRGIDPELIKKVAVKKGIITENEANNMSQEEAIYLIFKPGFSSKAEATQTSGRGVGMDVVKLHIEENLKGHIEIDTEKGKGTTFTLILPLTLAVIRSLIVRIGERTFALPTSNVQETILLDEEKILISGMERFVRLRNSYIPLVRLSDALQLEGIYEGKTAIIVNISGKTIAYEVEEIIDEQPIVIKPLSFIVEMSRIFAGATILGNGEIVLIINIGELVRNTKNYRMLTFKEAKRVRSKMKPKILVVEDSLTTREIEINLLRAAGFDAEGVRDGLEAISALNSKKYDLVLTDIQMPRMNGIELIRRVKSNEKFRDIPMVVVSTLGSESDIAAGLSCGADAYITKKDFNKETLLGVINRLLAAN